MREKMRSSSLVSAALLPPFVLPELDRRLLRVPSSKTFRRAVWILPDLFRVPRYFLHA